MAEVQNCPDITLLSSVLVRSGQVRSVLVLVLVQTFIYSLTGQGKHTAAQFRHSLWIDLSKEHPYKIYLATDMVNGHVQVRITWIKQTNPEYENGQIDLTSLLNSGLSLLNKWNSAETLTDSATTELDNSHKKAAHWGRTVWILKALSHTGCCLDQCLELP